MFWFFFKSTEFSDEFILLVFYKVTQLLTRHKLRARSYLLILGSCLWTHSMFGNDTKCLHLYFIAIKPADAGSHFEVRNKSICS